MDLKGTRCEGEDRITCSGRVAMTLWPSPFTKDRQHILITRLGINASNIEDKEKFVVRITRSYFTRIKTRMSQYIISSELTSVALTLPWITTDYKQFSHNNRSNASSHPKWITLFKHPFRSKCQNMWVCEFKRVRRLATKQGWTITAPYSTTSQATWSPRRQTGRKDFTLQKIFIADGMSAQDAERCKRTSAIWTSNPKLAFKT